MTHGGCADKFLAGPANAPDKFSCGRVEGCGVLRSGKDEQITIFVSGQDRCGKGPLINLWSVPPELHAGLAIEHGDEGRAVLLPVDD